MKKGVFIVIDGTDGSGKATQTDLLVKRFKEENFPIQTISFPQYGKKSAGPVEEYLEGSYGTADDVDAYKASVLFAVDRYDASKTISDWLENGTHVIADRYVSANMGHNGSKINDQDERKKFFEWEMQFEHELMGIPKPDLNFILHVPAEKTFELIKNRALKSKLKQDIHEANPDHLKAAEKTYLEMSELYHSMTLITCIENNNLLSPQRIHEKIWNYVKPHLAR